MSKSVIICGGGIIGCSIAYYLTLRGERPIIVERTSVACGASGKAGGFLAKDFTSQEMKPFTHMSFALHIDLAEKLNPFDFRFMDALSLVISGKETNLQILGQQQKAALPDWISSSVVGSPEIIGTTKNSGQYKVAGSSDPIDTPGITQLNNKITGVIIDGKLESCQKVIIAMGAWSTLATQWLNITVPIQPCKSQAGLFTVKENYFIPATALFVDYLHAGGKEGMRISPEVFPRPDETVFIGISEDILDTLNEKSSVVEPDEPIVEQIQEFGKRLSTHLEYSSSQACIFPVSPDGMPLIGKLTVDGAYIAAGHGCWGILHAPVTGLAMAELIVDGACSSIDLSLFDPMRPS